MAIDLEQLDVFYGGLSVNRAHIYARLPRPADASGLSLSGHVRGPRCCLAETLPVTVPLTDLGPGPTLLARALVPEPCFWSADLPAIYEVTVDLLRGSEFIASVTREIGLRAVGIRGENVLLVEKNWVLRGIGQDSTTAASSNEWHDLSAALVTSGLDKRLLREASDRGALVVVEVHDNGQAAISTLRRLAQFPAVAMVTIHGRLPAEFRHSDVAPNLLLAQYLSPRDELQLQPWAQLVIADSNDLHFPARVAALIDLPVIAFRPLAAPLSIDEARAACDILQRDLAGVGQFAGYIV